MRREELMIFPVIKRLATGEAPKITAPDAGDDHPSRPYHTQSRSTTPRRDPRRDA